MAVVCLAVGCGGETGTPPPTQNPPTPPASALPSLAALTAVATDPAVIAKDVATDPATLAWQLFLYLNWQATPGRRGVPDPKGGLGMTPTVWQTWKEVHEVYLAGGAAPLPWADGGPKGPPTLSLTEIDGTTLVDVNGNPITYTVAMNQGVFDYLVSRQLYGWNGQAALRGVGAAPVQFPASGMEIKASWKILDPIADKDRFGRYITSQAWLPPDDGGAPVKVSVGLTGLHVTSKALPNWIWMSFEQVENPVTTGVQPLLPMDPAVAAVNKQMQAALGTNVLASYQLMGVQTAFTAAGAPTLLANTQIETKFQKSSSCISCHARASVSTGPVRRLDFFVIEAGNLVGPTGDPPTKPFGPGPDQFSALDFVWSMREAQQ